MTSIKAEQKTKRIDFGETVEESFWLESPVSSPLPIVDHMEKMQKTLDSGVKDGVVCVFSEELSSKHLCELLAKIRDNGNRVYILANDFSEEMKNLDGCLIRYGGSRKIGSFLLINPNSGNPSGCLFTGRFSDGSLLLAENLLLNLDDDQIPVLFRYFCHQFWNRAEKEWFGHEDRDIDSSPVDIYPPVDDGCDFRYLQSVWGNEMRGALVTTTRLSEDSFLKFSNISNSEIISLYRHSAIDNNLVRSLYQKSNRIFAIDGEYFINAVKTGGSAWLVPKINLTWEDEVYALLLNNEQSGILDKHITSLSKSKIRYQYVESDLRETLAGKTILKLGRPVQEKYTIVPEKRIKLEIPAPQELFPKERFDNSEPDFHDDGRSVSIIFDWTNKPFTLPNGASRHKLYTDWENAQKNIMGCIDRMLSAIGENEKKEQTISDRIRHFFLGKQQKFKEYRKDLNTLRNTSFSLLEKADLQDKIAKINSIQTNIDKDSREITEEDRRARIQETIKEKGDEKDELKKELAGIEQEIDRIKTARQSLSDDYYAKGYIGKGASLPEFRKTLEKRIETAKKDQDAFNALEKKLDETKQAIKELEEDMKKEPKDDIQKKLDETRQRLKKLEDEAAQKEPKIIPDDLQKKLDETKQAIKELEDGNIQQQKLGNEAGTLKNKIKKISDEIKSMEIQLNNSGEKKLEEVKKGSVLAGMRGGEKKSGGSTDLTTSFPVPQFARLPSAGELYQHNGQNYLAIEYWEEYNEGKKEALRLNAKLCAGGGK